MGRGKGRTSETNGYLLARSPLSDLEETEFLRLGLEGKAAGWQTLRELADQDSRLDAGRLDQLIVRANHQASMLESLRASTAKRVLTSDAR
jgi:hypothetical protein